LRHARRETKVVERTDRLEVDVRWKTFDTLLIVESDVVPISVPGRDGFGRLEEAL
jgi:hypothetical protein